MSERLQKFLASAGLGSRRQIEDWIRQNRIIVNGQPAQIGMSVSAADRIQIDGKPVRVARQQQPRRVLAYYKPVGEMTTRRDPGGRPTVFDRLPPVRDGRWIAVGRLDLNTQGLLLLTNDGELANQLMHPSSRIEMREAGGEGVYHWYHVILREGRHREVRRLWESQGITVSRLIRVRYGPVVLRRGLHPGRWDELDEAQIAELLQAASYQPPAVEAQPPAESRPVWPDKPQRGRKKPSAGSERRSTPRPPRSDSSRATGRPASVKPQRPARSGRARPNPARPSDSD